jgi:hypothetical protein
VSATPGKAWRSLLVFELLPSVKGPLLWAALGGLALLVLPVRVITMGELSFNGQIIGQESRLVYVLSVGHSWIVFMTTLLTLCLCLDRTGAHYLRNNDLLVLSRSVGRLSFYLAKMASVLVPSLLFAALALGLFWEEIYRAAGVNLWRVFTLFLPLSLSMICLTSLYFLLRNFLGNFMIFFLWLFLLPIIYVGNLWRYLAPETLREGVPQFPVLGLLPQFGGLHAHSLGMVHSAFERPDTWLSLVNCGLWAVAAALAGAWLFDRKRL